MSCSTLVLSNVVTTVLTLRRGFSETECYCSCAPPDIGSNLTFVHRVRYESLHVCLSECRPSMQVWLLWVVVSLGVTSWTTTVAASVSDTVRTDVYHRMQTVLTGVPDDMTMLFQAYLIRYWQILQACFPTFWQLLRTVCQCSPYTDTFYRSATPDTNKTSSSASPVTVMLDSRTHHVLTVIVRVPHGQLPQYPSHTGIS